MKCKNCNGKISTKDRVCPNCEAIVKVPIYRKKWFWILILVFALFLFITIKVANKDKFSWSKMVLGREIPKPPSNKGRIYNNDANKLEIVLFKVDGVEYQAYVEACKSVGFSVDAVTDEEKMLAFNEEGYQLYLREKYNEEKMELVLDAPMKMKDLIWPTRGAGAHLPKTKSQVGKVEKETTEKYSVTIGDMPLSEYKNYVEQCQNAGFIIDYEKESSSYKAYDTNGYLVKISYIGFNRVSISIEETYHVSFSDYEDDWLADEPEDEQQILDDEDEILLSDEEAEEDTLEVEEVEKVDGMRPEFIKAMDEYEAFYDEYVAFMKKYLANPMDLNIISDYASMLNTLEKMDKDFEAWDQDEMSEEELAYYLEVSARVAFKMLDIL